MKPTVAVLMQPGAIALLSATLLAQAPPPPTPGVAKTLARPDLVLHYTDFGQGEPVLVLMGGPGMYGAPMTPVAQMIAKRARAILPDQRGTGQSMPKDAGGLTMDATLADFEALRKDLGLQQWFVLGNSWGGMVALDYAAKYPSSIKGLLLVGSGGASFGFAALYAQNRIPRMTADERAAAKYWAQPDVVARDPDRAAIENLRAISPSTLYDRTKIFDFIAYLTPGKEFYNPEAARLLAADYDKGSSGREEALRSVNIPALILTGRQDPVPESVSLENHSLLKGSQLMWLDRCGHMPWLDQPEAMEKAVFEFLFRAAPGR